MPNRCIQVGSVEVRIVFLCSFFAVKMEIDRYQMRTLIKKQPKSTKLWVYLVTPSIDLRNLRTVNGCFRK